MMQMFFTTIDWGYILIFQRFGIGSCCHQRNWSILTGKHANENTNYGHVWLNSITFLATSLFNGGRTCVWGGPLKRSVWVRETQDGQLLLLMQAHAVPFELNWRVWVSPGLVVLSKLCCFKIAKREARVLMFCVWRGVCAVHCVHTVCLHAPSQ